MEANSQSSFGKWLKKRRKALDLTQHELAKRLGCAKITLQKIEADQRRPSKQMAELLAEQLGIAETEHLEFIRFARMEPNTRCSFIPPNGMGKFPRNFSLRNLTNIPLQPSPLIGRDQDEVFIRKRLLDEDVRLLTLTGPPGVGKTRLAIQVALGLLDTFEDGVYFISLATVSDPDVVATTIAQTLGVNQVGERSFAYRLKEYLSDKQMLLVLDNLEQVITCAPFIAEILSECPWASILITSRTPLSIRGERQFPVPPLTLPDKEGASCDLLDLMRFSAIALFVDRAQAVNPGFVLGLKNSRTISAICMHLDGLPLAIELAAARVNFLSPQVLLEQISGKYLLHTDGLRDASERHRTLYHAIDWSYALLTLEQQLLLSRLSVLTTAGRCRQRKRS